MEINYISLGAGVQSSTMALMAKHGEIIPMPEFAVFADTQAEPKSVYTWLDWLEKQLPFPVYKVTKGNLTEKSTTVRTAKNGNKYAQSAIPAFIVDGNGSKGIMMRQCTTDFKIQPILSFVRKKIGKKVKAVQWMGISIDEISRMRDSREAWKVNRYPLIEMNISRSKCFDWMKNNNYPPPPRSSCVYCPFHNDKEWIRLKTEEPEEFQRAIDYEIEYQETYKQVRNFRGTPYLTKYLKPLSEVDFGSNQIEMFNNECEGYCGI